MNSKNNFNNMNVDALLKVVAAKLKMKPEVLRKQLEQGKFDEAMKNMKPEDMAKFQKFVKNPSLAEKMITDPQAKEMYRRVMGQNK
ncbi:MAG: hypothetical protein IJP18_03430 [Oscillospiraceae bacterium]|nr:hypothetical protein [Ruminococcus sp.]MBQ9981598.1 hypothetical protein [Oscillospiraceae bacterium]